MSSGSLSREQIRRLYDRFGSRQDGQAYEDAALKKLLAVGDFGSATSILEFGCGTGRLAEMILAQQMPESAYYVGIDISPVMLELTRSRLSPLGHSICLQQTNGGVQLDFPAESFDRFVSTYVIDLLADKESERLVLEAYRVLRPGGLICLAGLGHGCSRMARLVSATWSIVHRLRPQLVGGCRPVELKRFFARDQWQDVCSTHIVGWGIPSEVLVAKKLGRWTQQ